MNNILFLSMSAGIFTGGTLLLSDFVFDYMSKRDFVSPKKKKKEQAALLRISEIENDITNTLEIESKNDEKRRGYFIKSKTPSKSVVILSHGHKSSCLGDIFMFIDYYKRNNFNIFLIDHRASGKSDGEYVSFGYFESADLILWINLVLEMMGFDCEILLHGVSMGSATVLMAFNHDVCDNVKGVIADCSYTNAWDEMSHIFTKVHAFHEPMVSIINMITKKRVGYDLKKADPINSVKYIDLPIAFIHGDSDDYVPTYMVYDLFRECKSKAKSLYIFEGAGHAQSYKTDKSRYEGILDDFIKNILHFNN